MLEAQRVASLVYDTLKADSAFSQAIGGRLYRDLIPQAAALPAATVAVTSSVDSVTLGGVRVFDTVLVDVRLVGAGASYASINAAADRADAVLDGSGGLTGGADVVKLRRDAVQAFIETETGVSYAHLIQTYRTEAFAYP